MAQVVVQVGQCSEGRQFDPRPCHLWRVLCPWARHFTHLAWCESVWLTAVWGGGGQRGCRCRMAATLPSVCPRATTIEVYYHQYDCVWMNGIWNPVRALWVYWKAPYKSSPLLLFIKMGPEKSSAVINHNHSKEVKHFSKHIWLTQLFISTKRNVQVTVYIHQADLVTFLEDP